jgi:lysophospholipase L1-like esterase
LPPPEPVLQLHRVRSGRLFVHSLPRFRPSVVGIPLSSELSVPDRWPLSHPVNAPPGGRRTVPPGRWFVVAAFATLCPPGLVASPETARGAQAEPTTADEAAAKKLAAEAAIEDRYRRIVEGLPPEEQAWEKLLGEQLGSFYLPLHKQDRVAGRTTAWSFVRDEPGLPRVLLIGDSVSRGYTLAARTALAGKANVHRAPANCGPTASGLKHLDAWLGEKRWDLIHFNFGIHDRNTPLADYTARLEQLVERLEKTGATLVWATTTPIPDKPEARQTATSIVDRNAAAAVVMARHGVAIDDLFTFITPHLAAVQPPGDVHFTAAGYDLLGGQVAAKIAAALERR